MPPKIITSGLKIWSASMNDEKQEFIEKVKRYIALETASEVSSIKQVRKFEIFGDLEYVALVTLKNGTEWWVIGWSTPFNHYPKSQFQNPDEVLFFHSGLSREHIDRQVLYQNKDENPDEYHAFICHASEDKGFVDPLANELSEMGQQVWYDEFELDVGDSLRESIDTGLSKSTYGIVILSDSFFLRNGQREN